MSNTDSETQPRKQTTAKLQWTSQQDQHVMRIIVISCHFFSCLFYALILVFQKCSSFHVAIYFFGGFSSYSTILRFTYRALGLLYEIGHWHWIQQNKSEMFNLSVHFIRFDLFSWLSTNARFLLKCDVLCSSTRCKPFPIVIMFNFFVPVYVSWLSVDICG